jgi:predicted Zn finger-like uncharacterized protein
MDIICQSCQGKFKIAEGKVPAGKTAAVKCPRCKSTIHITPKEEAAAEADAAFDDLFEFDEDEADGYDAAEKPFDFMEEEGKTALVCESDALIREKIRPSLDILEYHITEVPNSREALKKMRYHNYDLVVINEYFDTQDPDTNPLLIYLGRMAMEMRRNVFVTLLTSRFRTMDHMIAFQKSVNLVLNIRNIDDFDKIIQRGIADFGLFYKVYKDSLSP